MRLAARPRLRSYSPRSSACSGGPKTFSWMSESSGPLNCATTPSARAARIAPTGASLKNAFGVGLAASSSCAARRAREGAGRLELLDLLLGLGQPVGELRGGLLVLRWSRGRRGTRRPSWLRRRGRRRRSPSRCRRRRRRPRCCPARTPSIQPGQTKVAKVPSTNDLPPFQSQAACAADWPPSVAAAS